VQFKMGRGEVEGALRTLMPILMDPETALLALECGTAAALVGVVQLYLHFGPDLERADKELQDLVTPLRAARRVAQEAEDEVERLVSLGAEASKTNKALQVMEWARKAAEESAKALGLLEDEQRTKAAAKVALEAEKDRAQGTVQLALDAMGRSCMAGGGEAIRVVAEKGGLSLLTKAEREFPTVDLPRGGGNKSLKDTLLGQL